VASYTSQVSVNVLLITGIVGVATVGVDLFDADQALNQ